LAWLGSTWLGLAWLGSARLGCIQPIAFEEFDHVIPVVLRLLRPLLGLDFWSTIVGETKEIYDLYVFIYSI